MRARSSLLVLALVLGAPGAALGDGPGPTPEEQGRADALKASGDAAMDARRYREALEAYTEAWRIAPTPALLYNRGRAHERLGEYPEALDLLESFRTAAPPELLEKLPGLDKLIADVRGRIATLDVRSNVRGARVFVRDRVLGRVPLSEPLRLPAGRATIVVEAEGYFPFRERAVLRGGETLRLEAELTPRTRVGFLVVESPVPGAEVSVDGRRAGHAPVELQVRPGPHLVRVTREGYEPAEARLVVAAGTRRSLDVPLHKEPGVTSSAWFWAGVGAAVLGGVALTAALLTERPADRGDIAPGQVSAPIRIGF